MHHIPLEWPQQAVMFALLAFRPWAKALISTGLRSSAMHFCCTILGRPFCGLRYIQVLILYVYIYLHEKNKQGCHKVLFTYGSKAKIYDCTSMNITHALLVTAFDNDDSDYVIIIINNHINILIIIGVCSTHCKTKGSRAFGNTGNNWKRIKWNHVPV